MQKTTLELIKDKIKPIISSVPDDAAFFQKKGYKAIRLEKQNFHPIAQATTSNKLCFIDGGSQELLNAPNFSLQLIRINLSIFEDNKKLSSERQEFFCIAETKTKNNRLFYSMSFIGDSIIKPFDIDSDDECLRYGRFKAKISRLGDIARRFAEIRFAEKALSYLDKDDIIILDGSLQCSYSSEKGYLDSLYVKAKEKNVYITALSKASSLLTSSGHSLIASLKKLSDLEEWYYYPVVDIEDEEHQAEMYIIKLHSLSKHIFRFEVYKHYKKDSLNIGDILALLKQNSKDPVFLGYPYGLINADKFARVSNPEAEYYRTIILSSLGKDIDDSVNILNSHDILDSI